VRRQRGTCEACGAPVRRLPLRETDQVYITLNPDPPADGLGSVDIVRTMHGEDRAEIVGAGRGRFELHARTCPQAGLF
jgi:hypothetical protein